MIGAEIINEGSIEDLENDISKKMKEYTKLMSQVEKRQFDIWQLKKERA